MAKTKYYDKDTQKWEYAETGCIPVRGTHFWTAQDLKPLHDYISNRVMATAEVCFLIVNVTSNQSDKSALEGLVLSVTYPDGRTSEAVSGDVIAFTEGSVTVQFPEVAGYKKPDNLSVSYAKGNVSQQVTYLAEEVTVNALVDGEASSEYSYEVSGDNIVCLTGSGTTFTGVTKWLVPHGVTITVTPAMVDGYTTSAVTHTASGVTGSVSVEWEEIRFGVFIEDTTGKLWTADAWDGSATANGVAVLTENCRFVVALTNAVTESGTGVHQWGDTTLLIPDITTVESQSEAELDFSGYSNTAQIVSADTTAYAALYAYDHYFPNGQRGYLGSVGEWMAIIENYSAVTTALNLVGTAIIKTGNWTSTQYNIGRAWYMDMQDDYLVPSHVSKAGNRYIRAFTTLKMDTV